MLDPQSLAIEELLPHRPPMCALDRLLEVRPSGSSAEALLRPDLPAFEGGRFRAVFALELMAQAIAAGVGYGALLARSPRARAGIVVGLDEVELGPCEGAVPGARLRVDSRLEHDIPPAAEHQACLLLGEQVLARGRVRLLVGAIPELPPVEGAPAFAGPQGCRFALGRAGAQADVAIDVGAAHPYLAGHFPGAPLLPAVGHLRLVEEGASLALGRPCELAQVARARFHEPVRPGDRLELRLELARAPELRWTLRRGEALVSRGSGLLR